MLREVIQRIRERVTYANSSRRGYQSTEYYEPFGVNQSRALKGLPAHFFHS